MPVGGGSESAEVQGASSTPSSVAVAGYFGRMEAFDPKVEEWSTYVERLEMFFVVNNVRESKKASSLLTLIGGKMYALLKSLTTPTKPTEMSFSQGNSGNYGKALDTEADYYCREVQVP